MNWRWAIRLCLPASVDTNSHVDVHSGYLPHKSEEKRNTYSSMSGSYNSTRADINLR